MSVPDLPRFYASPRDRSVLETKDVMLTLITTWGDKELPDRQKDRDAAVARVILFFDEAMAPDWLQEFARKWLREDRYNGDLPRYINPELPHEFNGDHVTAFTAAQLEEFIAIADSNVLEACIAFLRLWGTRELVQPWLKRKLPR